MNKKRYYPSRLRRAKRKYKKPKPVSIRTRLFSEGLSAGVLWGISIVTGISLDSDELRIQAFEPFCTTVNNHINCGKFVAILSVLALGITIFAIASELGKLRKAKYFGCWNWPPWAEGLTFYCVGLLVGLIGMIILL